MLMNVQTNHPSVSKWHIAIFLVLLATSGNTYSSDLIYGLEVNPLRAALTLSGAKTYRPFTGSFDFNSPIDSIEVSVPIAFVDDNEYFGDCCGVKTFMADLQLRLFRGNTKSGFYAGPLLKLYRITGTELQSGSRSTSDRLGFGAVIGIRRSLSNKKLFVGANISAGKFTDSGTELQYTSDGFLSVDNHKKYGSDSFLFIELLKVGYIF